MEERFVAGVTGAILVGGKSSRMGLDKALLSVGGRPLVEIVSDTMRHVFRHVILAGDDGRRFGSLGLPSFPDRLPGSALGGIHTALVNASDDWVFVASCDLPDPRETLIRRVCSLREGHDAVVPRTAKGIEPLFACYHRRCAAPAEGLLAGGRFRIAGLLAGLSVRWVEGEELAGADVEGRSFVNLNTPADLADFIEGRARGPRRRD